MLWVYLPAVSITVAALSLSASAMVMVMVLSCLSWTNACRSGTVKFRLDLRQFWGRFDIS